MNDSAVKSRRLDGRRILVIVGGGIAAYKVVDVVRRIMKHGASVRVIMTHAGTFFVHPTTFAAISGQRVGLEMFSDAGLPDVDHLEYPHWADHILVAPATADLLAKMAHGIADDLATTALIAATCPVTVAPAMNSSMYLNAATQANLDILKNRGINFIGPESGAMAAPDEKPGVGRMSEPEFIVDQLVRLNEPKDRPLSGKHVVITAGRTEEPIDAVRFLTNRSSGRMGVALAEEAVRLGARVTLVHGAVDVGIPHGVDTVKIQTALQLLDACRKVVSEADVVLYAAAVSDWRPVPLADGKAERKKGQPPSIILEENPDVAATTAPLCKGLKVAFALQESFDQEKANKKLQDKGVDAILLNTLDAMGSQDSEFYWITKDNAAPSGRQPKSALAKWVFQQVVGWNR